MPNYQGQLDGLCGPYAIANAFERCGVKNPDRIFETACKALSNRRWPDVLWDGTTFGDLKRMIKLCKSECDGASDVKITYPFSRNAPASNDVYWKRLDGIFEERPNIRGMILGLTRPSFHWIVAFHEGGTRINFVDTDPHRPFVRKNRSMLHAGSKNGNPKKWIIDRSELIVFEAE